MAKHNANYGSGTERVETPSGHLSANARHETPSSEFGLPEERKYPLNHGRAGNAKARASEEEHKGHITKSQEEKIDRRANKVLGESSDASFSNSEHPRSLHGEFKEKGAGEEEEPRSENPTGAAARGRDAFSGPRDVSDFTRFGPPIGDSIRERQSRGERVSGRDMARARDEMSETQEVGMEHRDPSSLALGIRLSPWWVACYISAVESEMWWWADWLAAHPSVEIS